MALSFPTSQLGSNALIGFQDFSRPFTRLSWRSVLLSLEIQLWKVILCQPLADFCYQSENLNWKCCWWWCWRATVPGRADSRPMIPLFFSKQGTKDALLGRDETILGNKNCCHPSLFQEHLASLNQNNEQKQKIKFWSRSYHQVDRSYIYMDPQYWVKYIRIWKHHIFHIWGMRTLRREEMWKISFWGNRLERNFERKPYILRLVSITAASAPHPWCTPASISGHSH